VPQPQQQQQQFGLRLNFLQFNQAELSISAAHRISSKIALNLGNHSKGSLPTQAARAKARSKLYKSAKEG
jgi:hypothetical protein